MLSLPWSLSMKYYIKGDGKGAVAPPLNGVVGRKAASTSFGYSKAMKNSGITWTPKQIYAYLSNPGRHIPGNKMSFAGLSNEMETAHLIAFLQSL